MRIKDTFHVDTGQVHGYRAAPNQQTGLASQFTLLPIGSYVVLEQEGDVLRVAECDVSDSYAAHYYVKAEALHGVKKRTQGCPWGEK